MMKDKLHILPMAVFAAAALTTVSCSMFNIDESGKLGGYWHLRRIDTLATSGVCDMSESPVFWAVQGEILEVRDVEKEEFVMFRYDHQGNTLALSDARVNQRELGDSAITDVDILRPYGINSVDETMTIETLDGSNMVLKSDLLKLYFKKF